MDKSSFFTTLGLLLDIIGVVGIYIFHLGHGKITEQTPSEKFKKYSTISFILILVGFAIQIFAQFIN